MEPWRIPGNYKTLLAGNPQTIPNGVICQGTMIRLQALQELRDKGTEARCSEYEEDRIVFKPENELLQQHLQKYGKILNDCRADEPNDLF